MAVASGDLNTEIPTVPPPSDDSAESAVEAPVPPLAIETGPAILEFVTELSLGTPMSIDYPMRYQRTIALV